MKREADQKVSTTQQQTVPLQQLQPVVVAIPLIDMVASKVAARKPMKSKPVGALKRAKVEVDEFSQQMDASNKMAEQQRKWAFAWKEAAEDAGKRKRAADSEVKASSKNWIHYSIFWRSKGHTMKKKYSWLRLTLGYG